MQVILDLGHVTFGNVSDWSAEEKDLGIEAQLPDIDEDDDGKCLGLLWGSPTHYPPHPSPLTLLIPHPLAPSSSLTHLHPPHPSPTRTLLIPHPPTTLLILTHSHPLHPSPTCTLFIPHPLTHAFTQPLTLIPLTYIHPPPSPQPTHSLR